MLESITAAVIGGVSLKGGSGRLGLVVLSALFLSVLGNGMNLARVDSKFQPIIIGLTLIVFVSVEKLREVRRERQ
jgi:ribose transport system permease protein